MFYRKIAQTIENHFKSGSNKILVIDGARQVGKTTIIRYVGQKCFENYIEINMLDDSIQDRNYAQTRSIKNFYMQVSSEYGNKMKEKENTLIFIDEIQTYPYLLTMLKFLQQDDRYTYIASGSMLGIALAQTTSIPMGSIHLINMYPMDFEEFLYAQGANKFVIEELRENYKNYVSPASNIHTTMMDLFRKYLLVGGMPDAVKAYVENQNIMEMRFIQNEIHNLYKIDASQYDSQNKLKIRRIYDSIPSNLENKKKRVIAKNIENKSWKKFEDYFEEFDYLIQSGIALQVKAVSNPVFPLLESSTKNLLKLYLNDVGILSSLLYGNAIRAILEDENSINLGSIYENVVACELNAHGHQLYYYDNRNNGEVDFLTNDYDHLSILPIEVKSGKNYTVHSALNKLVTNEDYHIEKAIVFSNHGEIKSKGKVLYLPIYMCMFL